MKTEKNILTAFLLNISFSIIEFFGGLFTNSVAIMSDAVHDLGDAISIGISFVLERISKKKPDNRYTYGYIRYSILGSLITTVILFVGSIFVISGAIYRLFNPVTLNYDGMILFAIFGCVINFLAAYLTKEGDSLNQKAVNLHMLEDVLGWVVVLIGSILIKFTDINYIDSLMSIGVSCFILMHSFKNLLEILDIFLVKTPDGISIDEIKKHLLSIDGVVDVHHFHVWSMDGFKNYCTLHVVGSYDVKELVREELIEHGIIHSTIEIEDKKDVCINKDCDVKIESGNHHHHHH